MREMSDQDCQGKSRKGKASELDGAPFLYPTLGKFTVVFVILGETPRWGQEVDPHRDGRKCSLGQNMLIMREM